MAKSSRGGVVRQDKSKPSNLPTDVMRSAYPDMTSIDQKVGDTIETWDAEYAAGSKGIKGQHPNRRY